MYTRTCSNTACWGTAWRQCERGTERFSLPYLMQGVNFLKMGTHDEFLFTLPIFYYCLWPPGLLHLQSMYFYSIGSLPTEIGVLSDMTVLELEQNSLTGKWLLIELQYLYDKSKIIQKVVVPRAWNCLLSILLSIQMNTHICVSLHVR